MWKKGWKGERETKTWKADSGRERVRVEGRGRV